MSNQTYGPPPDGPCPHGHIYSSSCPECSNPMSNKTDREICDAATPGVRRFSPLLRCVQLPDVKNALCTHVYTIEDGEFIAHFNQAKISEMLDDISAKDAEIERLKETLRDEFARHVDTAAKLRDTECDLDTAKAEIERLNAELDDARRMYCELQESSHVWYHHEGQCASRVVEPGHTREDYAAQNGWDYLYWREEQSK